jgi:hypothetical protein
VDTGTEPSVYWNIAELLACVATSETMLFGAHPYDMSSEKSSLKFMFSATAKQSKSFSSW